jgi:hypothetical protein
MIELKINEVLTQNGIDVNIWNLFINDKINLILSHEDLMQISIRIKEHANGLDYLHMTFYPFVNFKYFLFLKKCFSKTTFDFFIKVNDIEEPLRSKVIEDYKINYEC